MIFLITIPPQNGTSRGEMGNWDYGLYDSSEVCDHGLLSKI